MPFDVEHTTPDDNILQYFKRFSHPTTSNDGIEKGWPMNKPQQKKYLFDIERPWLRFTKPKNAMKWRKREDEKRQLKIIRLKKNHITSDSNDREIEGGKPNYANNNIYEYIYNLLNRRLRNSKREKILGEVVEDEHTDDNYLYPFQTPSETEKHEFSIHSRVAPVSKKALKILRLKRAFPGNPQTRFSIPINFPASNLESSGRMYLRNLNPEKRALKIIRLKKDTNQEDNEEAEQRIKEKPNYVSVMNPTGQFRFKRSDPELDKDQSEKRNLDEIEDTLSPLSYFSRYRFLQ